MQHDSNSQRYLDLSPPRYSDTHKIFRVLNRVKTNEHETFSLYLKAQRIIFARE